MVKLKLVVGGREVGKQHRWYVKRAQGDALISFCWVRFLKHYKVIECFSPFPSEKKKTDKDIEEPLVHKIMCPL